MWTTVIVLEISGVGWGGGARHCNLQNNNTERVKMLIEYRMNRWYFSTVRHLLNMKNVSGYKELIVFFVFTRWNSLYARRCVLQDPGVPELSSSLRILSLTNSSHCCRICTASSMEQLSRRILSMARSLSPSSRVPVLRQKKRSCTSHGNT